MKDTIVDMASKSNCNNEVQEEHHIVMLPFMAQGHLKPFLTLATHIHQTTAFKVTIATTPFNIKYLQTTISKHKNNSFKIHLAEIPFCSSDYGLPPNCENTQNLPHHQIGAFILASVNLEAPTHRVISAIVQKEGRPPLCLISDFFFGWATGVANSLGTVNVTFANSAFGTASLISLWLNLPHRSNSDDDGYFTLPGFPAADSVARFHTSRLPLHLRDADGSDRWSKFFQSQLSLSMRSFGWLLDTAEEIEPMALGILRNHFRLNAWTVGPLQLPPPLLNSGKQFGADAEKCVQWLDSHRPDSVIYVSFGSQNTIGETQMKELAMGLEESGRPFIWVIRPPHGHDLKGGFKAEWLPQGFEDRMSNSNQGLLVHNWAPQLDILSHKSTRLFLSHCGWNSTVESLIHGVPILGWPLEAEQTYISKMLMEVMGVSVELAMGPHGGVVVEGVKRLIDLATDESGKGGEMRKRALEVKEKMSAATRKEEGQEKGSSVKSLDDFVSAVLSNKPQRSMS